MSGTPYGLTENGPSRGRQDPRFWSYGLFCLGLSKRASQIDCKVRRFKGKANNASNAEVRVTELNEFTN